MRGRRNLDAGEELVADDAHRVALRRRSARLIALAVLLVAFAGVGLFLHLFLQETGPTLPAS